MGFLLLLLKVFEFIGRGLVSVVVAILEHLSVRAKLYLAIALLGLLGVWLWDRHEIAWATKQCEDAQAAKQAKIDALQKEHDDAVAKENAVAIARYNSLSAPDADNAPIDLAGCSCKLPSDLVRGINDAHKRPL